MKKLILILTSAILMAFNVSAVSIVSGTATNGTTPAGNSGNTILTTNAYKIYKITITSTNAGAGTIKFYDSPNHTITNLQAAYTNRTLVSSNHVVTVVDVNGRTNSYTNAVIAPVQAITAASLTARRVILELVIAAGTNTVTYEPSSPLFIGQGLMATNNVPLQYVIEYTPAL
jgi:hypothetical protein